MEQTTLFQTRQESRQRRPSPDPLSLPGFSEAKAHLESEGRPSAWITETVDTGDKHAAFLKDGRPWYKSQCEHYEGYWLLGGIGSAQCDACDGLLPGLMWDSTCKGAPCAACPRYRKEESYGQQHENDPAPEL